MQDQTHTGIITVLFISEKKKPDTKLS